VLFPKLNEKDLVDIPDEAKEKIKFIPVENVDEVLAHALQKSDDMKPVGKSESGKRKET
jgi:ATP-dependent Lon protease